MSHQFTAFIEENEETLLAAYSGAAVALGAVAGLLASMGAI